MLGKLNRTLLALTGLVLLAAGLAVLVGGLDLQRRWGFTMPDEWPFDGPKDVLLSTSERTRYRNEDWWWPTVIAALGVVVVGALWRLLAQLRSRRLRQVFVDSGDGAGAVLRGRALEDVVIAEAEALDGVERARVALTGKRDAPRACIVLALAPYAEPGRVLDGLHFDVLESARTSAGLAALPAEARLRAVSHRAARVM
ncbi:alkaline shock response membrane anchor protein AmaP [Actinacidiphila oryziradicis]|uniref:Alkaline shock response membrane anchor protein AmaP n=1 Tax=Actinacidiphila oryziradicis TaxID=2571141 RepID=A0A4U0SJR8_9ACTN|nr:alkaline shock response membrane anchor protein AmaP [Actinacidiphila oryziradicis]TKA09816.1 alkaline shock response membrane anchor protein AmaP [Actinacidiphila oryziradicis]